MKKKKLTREHKDYVANLRLRMYKLSVNQRELARCLVDKDLYAEDNISSLITSINYAMTCYRYSKKYLLLLEQIDEILSEYESKVQD